MAPIQPFDQQFSSVSPWQAMAADRLSPPATSSPTEVSAGTGGASVAQSMTMNTSFMQVSQVHQQVNAFLGTLGGNLQDNEMLRMMIALLVLNTLLTQGQGETRQGQAGSAALELLGMMSNRQSVVQFESSYSAIQIDSQQSSYGVSQSPIEPSANAQDPSDGPRLDLSA